MYYDYGLHPALRFLLVAWFILILSVFGIVLYKHNVSQTDTVAEYQDSENAVSIEVVTESCTPTAVEIDEVVPNIPNEVESTDLVEGVKYNPNFMHLDNNRITLDAYSLSLKAQELWEDKALQYYLITASTVDCSYSQSQNIAEQLYEKYYGNESYACVQVVTDTAVFWFFGDDVIDFLSVDDKNMLYQKFTDFYSIEEYTPDYTWVIIVITLVAIVVLCLIVYAVYRMKLRRDEVAVELLKAPLVTDNDPLLREYESK